MRGRIEKTSASALETLSRYACSSRLEHKLLAVHLQRRSQSGHQHRKIDEIFAFDVLPVCLSNLDEELVDISIIIIGSTISIRKLKRQHKARCGNENCKNWKDVLGPENHSPEAINQ